MVKMYVSPCVGIAVAGVASCICFLLITTFKKGRAAGSDKKHKKDDNRCACCLEPFLIDLGEDCSDCEVKSCRKSCSRWTPEEEVWRCLICHQKRRWLKKNKNWIEAFGGFREFSESSTEFNTAKTRSLTAEVEHVAINHDLYSAAGTEKEENSMETIRDIIEKIVTDLIGNVDDSPINRIYNHPAYDQLMEKYSFLLMEVLSTLAVSLELVIQNKSTTSTTNMAQMALKDLVERVVEEARKLPGLRGSEPEKEKEQIISDRSYEDFLAAAILNKVIEKFQNEYVDGNRNVLSGKTSNCTNSEIETGLEKEQEGDQDECDCGAAQDRQHDNHSQPLSLTIEERIEEVTTTYASDEGINNEDENDLDFQNSRRVPFPEYGMDIVDPFQDSSDESQEEFIQDLVTPVESWEENWLFQKRKIQARSEPVAMLVPNANADFRALIGDQNAEDTSDLSECSVQSDEEIEQELNFVIGHVDPKSSESLENLEKSKSSEKLKNEIRKQIIEKETCISKIKNEKNDVFSLKQEIVDKKNEGEEISRKIEEKDQNCKKEEKIFNSTEMQNVKCIKSEINPKEKVLEKDQFQKSSQTFGNKIQKTEFSNSVNNNSSEKMTNGNHSLDTKESDRKEEKAVNKLPNPESKNNENVIKFKTNEIHKLDAEDEVQQESEYTEHYDTATQKHMDSLTKDYGPMGVDEVDFENSSISEITPNQNSRKCRDLAAFIKGEQTSLQPCIKDERIDDKVKLATPPRPGTIAEREHKKWENAPPIENNPYSEENIQRRLLERQYTRGSDISGSNIPKSTGKPLQIVLGAKQLDVKRFGRDYYINDAMTSSEEKQRELGTNSSRPASSLSQHSNSGTQQDEICYDSTNSASPENPKFSSWQKNNELKDEKNEFQSLDAKSNGVTHCFNSEVITPKNWENSEVEKLLEKERRNNKNEINARLNNQEISNIHEPISDEKNKKIRRLDLRAYGFENDFRFKNSETSKSPQPRVVNKLDLKSFGYECGLRRAQSIQLDSRNHSNDWKPKITRTINKFNLTEREETKNHKDSNFDVTQSTEDLNRIPYQDGNYFAIRGIVSANSVPNITDIQLYESNVDVNMMRCKYENKSKFSKRKEKTEDEKRNQIRNKIKHELENSIENLSIHSETEKSEDDIPSLPSVRRLAQAFSKSTEILNHSKVSANRLERSTTPEIHLVESPRQMHSLTARSISKEFREGLRQVPQKIISPPAIRGKLEQKFHDNQTNSENDKQSLIGDISIISPGKLKNNIQFWEQLQKRN